MTSLDDLVNEIEQGFTQENGRDICRRLIEEYLKGFATGAIAYIAKLQKEIAKLKVELKKAQS